MSTKEWSQSWPDWRDDERRVELLTHDGQTVCGTLYIDDFFFDGEDEVPIFLIRLDDGTNTYFVDHEKWRFIN